MTIQCHFMKVTGEGEGEEWKRKKNKTYNREKGKRFQSIIKYFKLTIHARCSALKQHLQIDSHVLLEQQINK